MTITVATEEARKSFYPTPPELAAKLLEGIDWWKMKTILEPSAGKGNLVCAIGKALINTESRFNNRPSCRIDMIELDPALRGILTNNILQASRDDYWEKYLAQEKETDRRKDAGESQERIQESMALEDIYYAMYHLAAYCGKRLIHEDFLQFFTMEHYDLIVMNPPFANGDAHLLHAIELQAKYGGQIRCILNAETLRNPCTNRRKMLLQKLSELDADISYETGSFAGAERTTDVSVAIIKLNVPQPHRESEFFERFRKAEAMKQTHVKEPTEMTVTDKVEAVISQYRVEVNAGISLIQEYMAMQPYILERIEKTDYNKPILGISIDSDHADRHGVLDINKYVRAVRLKYWKALFMNKAIFGQLTSNLQESLQARVNDMVEVEFDSYNIRLLIAEMNAQMCDGVKDTILKLFQEMTSGYHWRDDPDVQNIHYYNGWATNKAHYINTKVILPCYGVFSDYKWSSETFKVYSAYEKLADIEKALNYLDGNMTAEVDLYSVLDCANRRGQTRNIHCKFFDVSLFKKGTMHIKWTNLELLDRFNIYCGKEKNWLPPSYGKKKYHDMDPDEQAVVDSFHGDNSPGSGIQAYEQILARADYYLAPATQTQLALIGATN